MQRLKIAIAHDYLRTYGGGERVLEALHHLFPRAPIFVATANWEGLGPHAQRLRQLPIETSWMQQVPLMAKKPILYRLLLPWVWRSFDTQGYDVVISSSGSNIAKAIPTHTGTIHICYCHTPPRFLYGLATERAWPKWLAGVLQPCFQYLRRFDVQTSRQVTTFVANSKVVAERIRQTYHRTAVVVYPPLTLPKRTLKTTAKADYFLVVSRLVKNKHVDLIVSAFNALNLPLVVVGTGPELAALQNLAQPNITFLGEIPDQKLPQYYQQTQALVVASEAEDFGITPLEANAYGTPVIAYYSGGFKETVIHGKTGLFFRRLTHTSLVQAVKKFHNHTFSSSDCVRHSQQFSQEIFAKRIKQVISDTLSISSP